MDMFPTYDPDIPMPKVKPCEDPKIEEDAVVKIMQLAICGAMTKPISQEDIYNELNECFRLFKDAGFIK